MEYTYSARVQRVVETDTVSGIKVQAVAAARMIETDANELFKFHPAKQVKVSFGLGGKIAVEMECEIRSSRVSRTKEGHFITSVFESPLKEGTMKKLAPLVGEEVEVSLFMENDTSLLDEAAQETVDEMDAANE